LFKIIIINPLKSNKMKTKKFLLTFAVLFIALISGCANDDFEEIDGVCPLVISAVPTTGSTNVPLDQVITATFNEEMNPATFTKTSFIVQGPTAADAVDGNVTFSGKVATFTPTTGKLAINTAYTATIKTSVKDLTGNALQTDYKWTFTTGVRPTVTITSPIPDATSVVLNKIVTADFSIAMNNLTINPTTFTLKQGIDPILGAVTYSGNRASFTPNAALKAGLTYTATITTGAESTAGVSLLNNYTWNFTTINGAVVTPPPTAASNLTFGVFGGKAGITNEGINTVIYGKIGTTAPATLITGFHDSLTGIKYTETPLNIGDVKGGIVTAGLEAEQGLLDATAAYNSISPASKPGGVDPGAGELGGLTLAPGIYKSAGATFNVTNGDLTLDAKGNPDAVWIFQTSGGALTVGKAGPTGAKSVKLINGALAKNVYWYVSSQAVINGAGGGVMVGTIIANSGVTFSTAGNTVQTVLIGKAISLVASVTMTNTTINVPAN
jgi:hypothetical protein